MPNELTPEERKQLEAQLLGRWIAKHPGQFAMLFHDDNGMHIMPCGAPQFVYRPVTGAIRRGTNGEPKYVYDGSEWMPIEEI